MSHVFGRRQFVQRWRGRLVISHGLRVQKAERAADAEARAREAEAAERARLLGPEAPLVVRSRRRGWAARTRRRAQGPGHG